MKKIASASILSADFCNLGKDIVRAEKAGCEYIHFDVMDGVFVPNISYGMPLIKSFRGATKRFFDVHLMIVEPERYIKEFRASGADLICFHVEATNQPEETIRLIHEEGCQAGIAIKPGTPIEEVLPYLEQVEMVLVMTVEPGFGGQKYIPECTEKVRELRMLAKARGIDLNIQVDGGVDASNVSIPLEAGANVIVAGSAVFKGDAEANVKAIMAQFPEV